MQSAHSIAARDMDLSNSGRDLNYWSLFRRRHAPTPVPNPLGTYSCDCDEVRPMHLSHFISILLSHVTEEHTMQAFRSLTAEEAYS